MTDPKTIYHLAGADDWRAAEATGAYHGSPQDRADGFIHFSTTDQVVESARKHRAGRRDVLLVAVDPAALGAALRFEPARGGALFPHLHGPLPLGAVISVTPLPLDAAGRHVFPPLDH